MAGSDVRDILDLETPEASFMTKDVLMNTDNKKVHHQNTFNFSNKTLKNCNKDVNKVLTN